MLIYKNVRYLVLTCVGANTQGVRCRIIAVLNFAMFTRTTLPITPADLTRKDLPAREKGKIQFGMKPIRTVTKI